MMKKDTLYSFSRQHSRRNVLGMGMGMGISFGLVSLLPAGQAQAVDLDQALQPRIIGNPDAPK